MNNSKEIYIQRINLVINEIQKNLDKPPSLAQCAKIACFSPYYFHRIFSAITGESLNYYTNRLRVEKAARLLRYSSTLITQISFECGFSSSTSLSRSFKQFFGATPREYRNGSPIEKSKICKEKSPIEEYLIPMSASEMKSHFPISIQNMPERRVAYVRVNNSFEEGYTIRAYKKLMEWSKRKNLFDSGIIFGMSIDDPMVTPKNKYRYEACITIPHDYPFTPEQNISEMKLPSCTFATMLVSGDFRQAATATKYLYHDWLLDSNFEPEHQYGMEIFLNKEKVCDWSYFDLKLCLPVKPLQKPHNI